VLLYRSLSAARVQINECNVGCEQNGCRICRHFLAKYFHKVRNRRIALACFGYSKAEDFAERDRVVELDVIQRDGYEAVTGVFDTRRYISNLIYPLEQVAAKQRALIIHVFRLYQLTMVHSFCAYAAVKVQDNTPVTSAVQPGCLPAVAGSYILGSMLFDPATGDVFLDVFDGAPLRQLRAGEMLFHAGSEADQVFNIVSGTLMATRIGTDGRRQVLSFLFRDNFVGLSASNTYFFTVEAVTAATVACRPRRVLATRLDKDPQAERAFLHMVLRVFENSLDLVYSLGQRTAVERLAVFLLYLRNRQRIATGLPESAPVLALIELPMSRQDIADFLGLKKETVSRSFTQLDTRGLITRPDNLHARITNLAALRELAGIQDFASPLRLAASP